MNWNFIRPSSKSQEVRDPAHTPSSYAPSSLPSTKERIIGSSSGHDVGRHVVASKKTTSLHGGGSTSHHHHHQRSTSSVKNSINGTSKTALHKDHAVDALSLHLQVRYMIIDVVLDVATSIYIISIYEAYSRQRCCVMGR
jgi:hypothetical protein